MLKSIMVHLDSDSSCANRLKTAIALAQAQGASLTGLYVYTGPRLKNPEQQLADLQALFTQQTTGSGLVVEFLDIDIGYNRIGVAEMVGYYASFADLLVISQPRATERDKQHEFITSPERLLLGTGCPILVIPASGYDRPVGRRAIVAWKAGPKASRALHDAMPLLRTADHVSAVSVGDKTFSRDEHKRLSSYLKQHGIDPDVTMVPLGHLSVEDTLLNLVADYNADLLVFGVHITTRRGQFDMGRIGESLLQQMTVPMLISH